jgi:hypothetical protein
VSFLFMAAVFLKLFSKTATAATDLTDFRFMR